MLFAPNNATVVEFPMRPHVDRSFGHMAAALGLQYWVVPEITAYYHSNYTVDNAKAEVVVRVVRHILQSQYGGLLLRHTLPPWIPQQRPIAVRRILMVSPFHNHAQVLDDTADRQSISEQGWTALQTMFGPSMRQHRLHH